MHLMARLFIVITPRSTLTRVLVPIRVPSMIQIDLFKHYYSIWLYVKKKLLKVLF